MNPEIDRQLVAIMFTDIVGYTALMQADEKRAVEQRAKDRIMLSEHIAILLQLGYISYNYQNIESSTDNAILEGLDWDLNGWNFGTGVALKF